MSNIAKARHIITAIKQQRLPHKMIIFTKDCQILRWRQQHYIHCQDINAFVVVSRQQGSRYVNSERVAKTHHWKDYDIGEPLMTHDSSSYHGRFRWAIQWQIRRSVIEGMRSMDLVDRVMPAIFHDSLLGINVWISGGMSLTVSHYYTSFNNQITHLVIGCAVSSASSPYQDKMRCLSSFTVGR